MPCEGWSSCDLERMRKRAGATTSRFNLVSSSMSAGSRTRSPRLLRAPRFWTHIPPPARSGCWSRPAPWGASSPATCLKRKPSPAPTSAICPATVLQSTTRTFSSPRFWPGLRQRGTTGTDSPNARRKRSGTRSPASALMGRGLTASVRTSPGWTAFTPATSSTPYERVRRRGPRPVSRRRPGPAESASTAGSSS